MHYIGQHTWRHYKFSHFAYTWRQTLEVIRKNLPGKIFPQPQEFGARLVTVTNEPVLRPSSTYFAFSQAKHFFFSTSWEYRGLPIWLKTLNPKGYAEKYWSRKGLDVYLLVKREQAKCKKQKTFLHKMNAMVLILVSLQNSNSDIQLLSFSWFDSTN